MTDEQSVYEEATIVPPVVDLAPEPYEWFEAFQHGESIGSGPTPVPDDIREQATEIRWSNPSSDKSFPKSPEPISSEILERLKNEPPIEYTPPLILSDAPNVERTIPESQTNPENGA